MVGSSYREQKEEEEEEGNVSERERDVKRKNSIKFQQFCYMLEIEIEIFFHILLTGLPFMKQIFINTM